RNQRLGVETILPNREYMIAGSKYLLGAELHAKGANQRQRPEIRLRCPLEEKLVLQLGRHFRARAAVDGRGVGERGTALRKWPDQSGVRIPGHLNPSFKCLAFGPLPHLQET